MSTARVAGEIAPEWEIGDRVKLTLTYEGSLPSSGNKGKPKAANHLRRYFNLQLRALCETDTRVRHLLHPAPGKRFGGILFNAIVQEGLVAELEIDMLRRDPPGQIFNGGDVDGRLKTLLDGLRMPNEESQVQGFEVTGNQRTDHCICLLTDDRQVVDVTIKTGRLLRPLRDGESATDVELRIRAVIERADYGI